MRGHRDLSIVSFGAVVCGILAVALPWGGARLVAALPLALCFPGYAFVAASFGPGRLEAPKVLAFSLGSSLAILVLGGLLLDLLPGGLQTASWACLLVLLTVGLCLWAATRRPSGEAVRSIALPRGRTVDVLAGLLALGLAAGALFLANTPLSAENTARTTALWILPVPGAAERDAVRVGVESVERERGGYLLDLEVDGREVGPAARFQLRPGGKRVFDLPLGALPAGAIEVTAILRRQSDPETAYRNVSTWLPAESE